MIKKMKSSIIESSKEILGGEPVFCGTRVPIRALLDYLEAGDSFEVFLLDYPTVTKIQVIEVLELAKKDLAQR